VHHTNEIAQSEVAYDKPLAKYWLHGAFLLLGEKRMGKSEGNFMTLSELRKSGFEPLAYRYLTLTTHYRGELRFTSDSLQSAQNAFNNLRMKVASYKAPSGSNPDYEERFMEAIEDDLDMPTATSLVWELIKSDLDSGSKHGVLLKFDKVLGLGLEKIPGYEDTKVRSDKVQELIREREEARKAKDWKKADKVREELESKGILIEDTPQGPRVKVIPNKE